MSQTKIRSQDVNFAKSNRIVVRDELVIILDPLALSVKSDFSAGYGSLDPQEQSWPCLQFFLMRPHPFSATPICNGYAYKKKSYLGPLLTQSKIKPTKMFAMATFLRFVKQTTLYNAHFWRKSHKTDFMRLKSIFL